MSSTTAFARHRRRSIDHQIHAAYVHFRGRPEARASFEELLGVVRVRAPRVLWMHECARYPGVSALVNLAGYADRFVRPIATWPGCRASWHRGIHSLAQHLLCTYAVPAFLGAAWRDAEDDFVAARREWFIAHGAGVRFRSLDLPVPMTRRMEDLFLRSPDHLTIEQALRRAELLALGARKALVDAVLAAPPAISLQNGAFWHTVWLFMIANSDELDPAEVGPIIDFLDATRHQRVEVETVSGRARREPLDPTFSMRGRTLPSLRRLMEQWHRGLATTECALRWDPSPQRPMAIELPREDPQVPPVWWEMRELTNSEELKAEGRALQHCVASYAWSCAQGRARIWSLRRRRELHVRPLATVEVDPRTRRIVQARGFRNARVSGRALEFVQQWARRESLHVAI